MAKEKKKRRKSVSEFFSTLNTNKAENLPSPGGEVVVSKKSKVIKWLLSGTVIGLTTIGITVPWALASCAIIDKAPIDSNETMYTIKIGDVVHTVTYKDFEERTNAYVARDNQKIIDLTNSFNASVVKKLYDEEHNAYVKFKAIIDQKNKDLGSTEEVGPTTYGNDVAKSSDKIAEEQAKNLQDAKRSFQGTGDKDWIEKWTMELKTNPIYGFQDFKDGNAASLIELESKAVEFMTTTALKKPALARFEAAQIVTDKWTAKDLSWEPSKDIKYQDPVTNVETTITKDNAKNFLYGQQGFLEEGVNVVRDPKPTVENQAKLAVFQTNSYMPEFRKPNTLLKKILPNFFNSAVISSVDLAIKPGEKNFTAFTFDKTVLTNLFTITTNPKNNLIPANKFAAILQLSKFQGAMLPETTTGPGGGVSQPIQPSLNQQRALDEQLITNLGGTSTDQPPADDGSSAAGPGIQLGSSKFKIFNEHTATADNEAQRWTNIVALGSDANSFRTTKQNQQPPELLFTPKKVNPINIFLDLLLSINGVDSQIDFDKTGAKPGDYTYLKEYWNKIAGEGKASQGIVRFVELIKANFDVPATGSNPGPVPFQQQPPQPPAAADTILGENRGLTGVKNVILNDYNTLLQNAVDSLTEADITWLGNLFTIVFMDKKAKVNNVPGIGLIEEQTGNSTTMKDNFSQTAGFWSTYQLSEKTFLQVNNEGMKIFTREVVTSGQLASKIDQMIIDDLTRTLDTKTATALLYEVTGIYQKINTDEIINVSLINEENSSNQKENAALFKYKLAKDLFPNKDIGAFDAGEAFLDQLTTDEKKQVNDQFTLFNNYLEVNVTSYFAKEENKTFEKITDLLNTNVQLNKYYEFTTIEDENKQSVLYWQTDPEKPYQYNSSGSGTGSGSASLDQKLLGINNIESEFVKRYLNLIKAYKTTSN